jgi:intracellular sulfur oxidation DsrE/DsrF family protein
MSRRLALLTVWSALADAALAAGADRGRPAVRHDGDTKVLYEIPTRASARTVLRAVESHLDQRGTGLAVAIVAHGSGVESMLVGATDEDGDAYAPAVERLARRGVVFSVCNATLQLRGIDRTRLIAQSRIVPRGSREIARLIDNGYRPLN